jgi:hypothetical protein
MSVRFGKYSQIINWLSFMNDCAEVYLTGQFINRAIQKKFKLTQETRYLVITSIRKYIKESFGDLQFDEMTWQGGIECFLECPLDERYSNAGAMLSWLIANNCSDEAAEILKLVQEKYPHQFDSLKSVLLALGVSELPKIRHDDFCE